MATPIQIIAALTIENTYHILYPTTPINYSQFEDITDWAGLGYSTGAGDVVKGIFKVIDPAGQVIYENSGYATDNFSSPDWSLTSLTAPQFNLLTYSGTNTPIYGDYQFLWKVQVTTNVSSAAMGVSITQAPTVSLPQIDLVAFTGIPVAGDVASLSYQGIPITYTAQSGDTAADMATGLYNAIQAYRAAHPLSGWRIDFSPTLFSSTIIKIEATTNNTPFTLVDSYTPSPSGTPFVVGKTFIVGLSNQLSPVLTLEDVYDCAYATFTSTDTTIYGAPAGYTIQNIAKVHVTRPPLVSKKSDGVTAQPTVTSSSTTNLLAAPNNPLWTGSYSSSIAAVVTYKSGNNYTIVNCPAVEKDTNVVCDTSLCKLFCYLKKLYTKYFDFLTVGNTVEANMALAKWQKGSDIFMLIWKATTCSTGDVESLTQKFYDVTGFSAGCDCGCDGDLPAPVIPTNVINGTNGTDGLTPEFRVTGTLFQWRYTTGGGWTTLFDFSTITGLNGTSFLQGSGVPSNGLGENGDSYLDVDTDNIYLKTAGVWAVTGNIKGESGSVVLYNDITNSATTGTSLQTLKTYTIPANKLSTDGSYLIVKARFSTSTATTVSSTKTVGIYFNGSAVITGTFNASNIDVFEYEVWINRFSNTVVKIKASSAAVYASLPFIAGGASTGFASTGGLNLTTTTYDITAKANSDVIGDLTCENLTVTYFKK